MNISQNFKDGINIFQSIKDIPISINSNDCKRKILFQIEENLGVENTILTAISNDIILNMSFYNKEMRKLILKRFFRE